MPAKSCAWRALKQTGGIRKAQLRSKISAVKTFFQLGWCPPNWWSCPGGKKEEGCGSPLWFVQVFRHSFVRFVQHVQSVQI